MKNTSLNIYPNSYYDRFLIGDVGIHLKNNEEYEKFCHRCSKIGLHNIMDMKKGKFESMCRNNNIPEGEFCMEYQLCKGFSFSTKESYEKYGSEVIELEDFLIATQPINWPIN